jgi:hypothetical protein
LNFTYKIDKLAIEWSEICHLDSWLMLSYKKEATVKRYDTQNNLIIGLMLLQNARHLVHMHHDGGWLSAGPDEPCL